jgi:hypothetical protein
MRAWKRIVGAALGISLSAGSAFAAPGSPSAIVVDRGLHRQWIVVCDPQHPERPPRLVEVPWSEARTAQVQPAAPTTRGTPLVRPGMTVSIVRRSGDAEMHLEGTALETGWSGDAVRVRAGLHGAALRAVVRGPGLVELLPGKAKD